MMEVHQAETQSSSLIVQASIWCEAPKREAEHQDASTKPSSVDHAKCTPARSRIPPVFRMRGNRSSVEPVHTALECRLSSWNSIRGRGVCVRAAPRVPLLLVCVAIVDLRSRLKPEQNSQGAFEFVEYAKGQSVSLRTDRLEYFHGDLVRAVKRV
jgi:hypothetical protein